MFIELIDLLRCPREHEETWLVAAFNRMSGRFVLNGKLGCPVCNAEYSIFDGVPDLRIEASNAASQPAASQPAASHGLDPESIAAFLNLTREGATVLLTGAHADSAQGVADLAMSRTFAIRSSSSQSRPDSELVATVLADSKFPFATSSIDGVALADDRFSVSEAARILKPGGRLVAPSKTKLAGNLRELARDGNFVVAEAIGPLLNLRR